MSTIKDVAKAAGVSTATVSHVLNQTKEVLPETRERVMEAVKQLNYMPNPTAKSFKTGKRNIIAFVVPDISNNYFANMIEALEERLRSAGYHLILVNTNENVKNEICQIQAMTSGIADGLILASTAKRFSDIEDKIPPQFPVVLVDRKLEGCPYDTIAASDRDAVIEGVEHLSAAGHRKIGYLGDIAHLSTARERQAAYEEAMQKLGLMVEEKWIIHISSRSHKAYEKTGELLQKGCSAVVVGSNHMTVEAYSYVWNHRTEYPDVSILGYQHKELSHVFSSNAGIIVSNETEIGIAAAEQILQRIKDPQGARREVLICNQYLFTDS